MYSICHLNLRDKEIVDGNEINQQYACAELLLLKEDSTIQLPSDKTQYLFTSIGLVTHRTVTGISRSPGKSVEMMDYIILEKEDTYGRLCTVHWPAGSPKRWISEDTLFCQTARSFKRNGITDYTSTQF